MKSIIFSSMTDTRTKTTVYVYFRVCSPRGKKKNEAKSIKSTCLVQNALYYMYFFYLFSCWQMQKIACQWIKEDVLVFTINVESFTVALHLKAGGGNNQSRLTRSRPSVRPSVHETWAAVEACLQLNPGWWRCDMQLLIMAGSRVSHCHASVHSAALVLKVM